jgi:hypothetical protein
VQLLHEAKHVGDFSGNVHKDKQKQRAKLSRSQIRRAEKVGAGKIKKLIRDTEKRLNYAIKLYRADEYDKRNFKLIMQEQLKNAHREAYELGCVAAGVDPKKMSKSERDWLAGVWKTEKEYLDKFLASVIQGESKAKSKQRVKAYAATLSSIYDAARALQVPDNTIIHWIMNPAEHCQTCIYLARVSPFTPDTLPCTPRDGTTDCKGNCKCDLMFASEDAAKAAKIRKKHVSRDKAYRQVMRHTRHG